MRSGGRTHSSHEGHPLEMVNGQNPYTCDGCKMDGMGIRHRCERCNYDLHNECMSAAPTITVRGYNCIFLQQPFPCHEAQCHHGDYCRSCNACGMTVKGFVYHCPDKEWDFHPQCAKLPSKICIGDVIFRLDENQGSSKCALCQRKQLRGVAKNIPGWSYKSNFEDYNFHVHCVMDMAMRNVSSDNKSDGESNMYLALRKKQLPLQSKSRRNRGFSWLKIIKIFLKTIISLLIGDLTTVLASTLELFVTEGIFDTG